MAFSYTQAVRMGAKLMDQVSPGWAYKIKITDLDMGEDDRCILGQAFGSYWDEAKVLFNDSVEAESVRHGFDVLRGRATQYDYLGSLWANEVRTRRGRSGTRGNRARNKALAQVSV